MKRFGQIIRVKNYEDYKYHHAHPWSEVDAMIRECNISNYSIFHREGWLFAYFEYGGSDYEADMARMAAHPKTREWWDLVKPMMIPLPSRGEGEFWSDMEEIYHLD